nr:I78 family peptidase inhibitor [uncultured Sphingomonas sp.]
MTKLIVLGPGAALLAACATVGPAQPAGNGTCSNEGLQQFVGQPASADLGARVLSTSGAKALQWVAAGTMVTMEYRADRVRIYLDEQNRVQRLSCG